MRYILVTIAAVLLLASCEGSGPVAPATLPDMKVTGGMTSVFWDPFGGPTGESLHRRRPPQGGGTWVAWDDPGPATLWRGSARLENGSVWLWLDEPLNGNHEVQVTVLDLDTVGESFGISGRTVAQDDRLWDIWFLPGTGFVARNMTEPWSAILLLPTQDMANGGDYTITVRDVNYATRTYAVDIVGRFPGGGVSSHTEGIILGEVFNTPWEPELGIAKDQVIDLWAFESQPKDGVRFKDLRVRAERPATASVSH